MTGTCPTNRRSPANRVEVLLSNTVKSFSVCPDRQAFSVNSYQNYCYEGTNYNGQTDKNPADGDPRGFWNDTHAFIAGAAIQWLRDGLGIIESAGETEQLARSLDGLEREHVALKRPGTGIPPRFLDQVVGRRAARPIAADTVLTWEMLQ